MNATHTIGLDPPAILPSSEPAMPDSPATAPSSPRPSLPGQNLPGQNPPSEPEIEIIDFELDPAVKPEDLFDLTDQQVRALFALTAGKSLSAAARAANVHRGTVLRWLRDNDHFAAMHNAWQVELRDKARTRLLRSVEQAVDVVITALDAQDPKTALMLLKRLAILTPISPGPTTATEVKKEREMEAKMKDTRRQMNELMIRLGWTSE